MRRFPMKNKKFVGQFKKTLKISKSLYNANMMIFEWPEVYLVAKASGLRSNKKRHIVKRFRLIMEETINDLVSNYSVDNKI